MSIPEPPHHTHRLLSAAQPLEEERPGKGVLPLSSGFAAAPGERVNIRTRSQVKGLHANRLLVADHQEWRISTLRVGPRIGGCQFSGDHPALSNTGTGVLSLSRLPMLSMDGDVTLEVERIGSGRGSFSACLCMEDNATPNNPSSPNAPATMTFLAKSTPIARGEQIRLSLPKRAHDLHVMDLILRVSEPAHWFVSDISINGDTLLVKAGDLPGELLTDRPGRAPLRLGRLRAGEELVVQATYYGPPLCAPAPLTFEARGSELPINNAASDSAFLPMSCGVPIYGAQSVQVNGQIEVPTGYAFLPEEVLLRDPEKWVVEDIQNGNNSEFSASGSAPGILFGGLARGCQPNFGAVRGGSAFSLIFTYMGSKPEGETLACGVVGRVVRLPPPEAGRKCIGRPAPRQRLAAKAAGRG